MQCCSACKKELPLTAFSKCSSPKFKNGRQYICKICKASIQRDYRKTKAGKQAVLRDNNKGLFRKRKYATSERGRLLHKAVEAKRRAIKMKATPSWANLELIRQFYINCPKGYHVDHIIPLKGKIVCGLHVLENLQYLTAEENLKKGNRFNG